MIAQGTFWFGGDDGDLRQCHVEISRSDDDEVAFRFVDDDDGEEVFCFWATREYASRIGNLIGVAVLSNELAGHEAAQYEAGQP